jgi:hypothetical protein
LARITSATHVLEQKQMYWLTEIREYIHHEKLRHLSRKILLQPNKAQGSVNFSWIDAMRKQRQFYDLVAN